MRLNALASLALLSAATAAVADEPTIDFSELSNGLDLIVVEKHNVPLVTIEIAVKTGSFTETPETNGLSHLYEHMFFKGNAALPTQAEYMARVSELGISFNGTTSTERVNYFFTLPSRNFVEGMQFMHDALLKPLFDQDQLVSERKVVIGEYDRNEADPNHYLWEGLRKQMYGEQAYRKNPLGERDVILSATTEIMNDFKEQFYLPNNALLLIVGDVNPTEAKVMAERLFGARQWEQGHDPHDPPRAPLPRLDASKSFVAVQPTEVISLGVRWPGPDVGRDERATFVADVWGTLCGLAHARFQKAFRDEGLADGVGLHYYTQREGGEINFSATVRDGKWREVRDVMLREVAAMAEAGYWSDEDIALAKKSLRIGRAYEAESGADFSHTLSFWWASSSYDYYTRYLSETDSVTADELQSLVRNYLVGRPFVIGALTNQGNAEAHGISEQALLPDAAPASAAESAVQELVLDNGIQVLFRHEPGSAVTALDVYFDSGCATLTPRTQGIDRILTASLLEGSERLTRDQLQAEWARLGARPGVDSNYDYSRISLVAPRDTFTEAAGLVGECIREPRFDAKSLDMLKGAVVNALNAEKANPDSYVVRVLNQAFFAKHPYVLRPDGTPETVATFTPDVLRERLAEFDSQRLLLVVVGDHDAAQIKQLLQAQFGSIPTRGKGWQRAELPAFTPEGLVAYDTREIPTNYVIAKVAGPGPGHPDYAAAKLAMSVLRQRFWETLRTKHALTYAPAAGLSIYRSNYAYLYASTTQPAKAIELMHEDIRRLQTELVPVAELQGLIAQAETRAYVSSESAGSHANGLGYAQLSAGDWRQHYRGPAALARVTPEDVQRAAQTYLKDFCWGIIGPDQIPEDVLRGTAGE
jgi:zinc protease